MPILLKNRALIGRSMSQGIGLEPESMRLMAVLAPHFRHKLFFDNLL